MTPDTPLVGQVTPSPNFDDRRGKTIDALILHYTGMPSGAAALAWLCNPASSVSCHYFVWEDGRIEQLVAEADRAWHAGRSYWAGETDLNAVSLGIEIVNGGHPHGLPPYPEIQIDAVIALARDICARRGIAARRVLAHSDVAPDRKEDPGELFPWDRLAAAGVGLFMLDGAAPGGNGPRCGDHGPAVAALQRRLADFGYDVRRDGVFDERTEKAVIAFQRHFRPSCFDGVADAGTLTALDALLGKGLAQAASAT